MSNFYGQYIGFGGGGSVALSTGWFGARALIAGGENNAGTKQKVVDYVAIATEGDAADWGDLLSTRSGNAGLTGVDKTRGLFGSDQYGNDIDYVTVASLGSATDFGDRINSARNVGACSNGTRGVFAGGYISGGPTAGTDDMDYVTIATTGNANVYGDMTIVSELRAGVSNSTRGLFAGVYPSDNVIDYITIASIASAIDFGDRTAAGNGLGACGSETRGVFMGASNPTVDVIDYVTIASIGNALDFGNCSAARRFNSCSTNGIRALSSGNYPQSDVMEFVVIETLGDATDFGNLTTSNHGVLTGSLSGT